LSVFDDWFLIDFLAWGIIKINHNYAEVIYKLIHCINAHNLRFCDRLYFFYKSLFEKKQEIVKFDRFYVVIGHFVISHYRLTVNGQE